MRFSLTALATTTAVVWGACLLIVGVAHLIARSYGVAFLDGMSSVYPGFHAARTAKDVFVGTLYGVFDGAIGGLMFGWVYNVVAGRGPARQHAGSL